MSRLGKYKIELLGKLRKRKKPKYKGLICGTPYTASENDFENRAGREHETQTIKDIKN